MHNYTIGPTNWDYKEVSVINSLRGDAVTRIVYRRTDGQTEEQTDIGVLHKLDLSRPVELKNNILSFQMATALNSTVPCAQCDNPAAKFHCDTCGKALCAQCRENHLGNKITRHHEIVEYAKKLSPNNLANLVCKTHNTPDPELWCDTCGVPICFSCITGKHNGHKVSKITTILSNKRDVMREEMKALRDRTISEWETVLKEAQKIKVDFLQDIEKIDEDLVTRTEEMIKQVKAILSQSRATLREMKESSLDQLDAQEKYLNDKLQQLRADVQKYEDRLLHADSNALIQFKQGSIQPTETPPSLNTVSVPVFVKGQNDISSMQKMFGQLATEDISASVKFHKSRSTDPKDNLTQVP